MKNKGFRAEGLEIEGLGLLLDKDYPTVDMQVDM